MSAAGSKERKGEADFGRRRLLKSIQIKTYADTRSAHEYKERLCLFEPVEKKKKGLRRARFWLLARLLPAWKSYTTVSMCVCVCLCLWLEVGEHQGAGEFWERS